MANPHTLNKPPITEALIDFRTQISAPQEAFEAFAKELEPEFPTRQVRHGMRAELRIDHGRLIPPKAEKLGFQGVMVTSADETLKVQFGPEGFTLNNLGAYQGGERLVTLALALWSRFASRMSASVVTRVAFRYINRLDLPLRHGDPINRYLVSPPELPEGAPQNVSDFLSRIVAREPTSGAIAIVTQRMNLQQSAPVVLIDVDVFKQGEFSPNQADLRLILDSLRLVKNSIFFSLLTEEAVALYL